MYLQKQKVYFDTNKAKNFLIDKLKKFKSFNKIKDLDELLDPYLEIKISRFFIFKILYLILKLHSY